MLRAVPAPICFLSAVLLLTSAVSPSVRAQDPGDSQLSKAAETTCTLQGVVVDSTTRTPLRQAAVLVIPMGGGDAWSIDTGEDGEFCFRNLASQEYKIHVGRVGYDFHGYRQPGRAGKTEYANLEPGAELHHLEIPMVKHAVISGRVTDENGDPIRWAQVDALRQFRSGRVRGEPPSGVGNARTNDLGEYRIFDLSPGAYVVKVFNLPGVWRPGVQMRANNSSGSYKPYSPVYYPGTTDVSRATVLNLKPGEEVAGIDFAVRPVQGASVHGRVFYSKSGCPEGDGFANLFPVSAEGKAVMAGSQRTVVSAAAQFEFNAVAPGNYDLLAVCTMEPQGFSQVERLALSGGETAERNLSVFPGAEIAGRATADESIHGPLGQIEVELSPLDEEAWPEIWLTPEAELKPDGSFLLKDVREGKYAVTFSRFSGQQLLFISSVRWGGDDGTTAGITVTSAEPDRRLTIVFSATTARVEGTVVDEKGEPVVGAVVAAVPRPRSGAWRKEGEHAETDQTGRFELSGMKPGDYSLFAWDQVEWAELDDEAFLRRFDKNAELVTIQRTGTQQINLKLLPSGSDKP